jgi:hypothetical protein
VWRRSTEKGSNAWGLNVVQAGQAMASFKTDELIVVQALDAMGREGPRRAFRVTA